MGELVGMAGQPGNIFDTDEGVVVGTTDFMSPEQVKDQADRCPDRPLQSRLHDVPPAHGDLCLPRLDQRGSAHQADPGAHVPIADVRPGLSPHLVAIVDRLLAIRPGDRFASAEEAAEALEALIPAAGQSESGTRAKPVTRSPTPVCSPFPTSPNHPWTGRSSNRHSVRPVTVAGTPHLVERNEPKPPSTKGLSSHRKILEEEGVESGRDVHKKYRDELIQMNRAMAELRSTESKDEAPPRTRPGSSKSGRSSATSWRSQVARADPHRRPGGPPCPRAGLRLRRGIGFRDKEGTGKSRSTKTGCRIKLLFDPAPRSHLSLQKRFEPPGRMAYTR